MKAPNQRQFKSWSLEDQKAYIKFALHGTEIAPDLPSWIFHPQCDISIQFIPTKDGDISFIKCSDHQRGIDDFQLWEATKLNVN